MRPEVPGSMVVPTAQNDPSQRTAFFDSEFEARFIRLSNLRAPGGLARVGAAEIEVLASSEH